MAWNANGLMHQQQELQLILDIESIDVCLVPETHFTNSPLSDLGEIKFITLYTQRTLLQEVAPV
jgi:hypothetical protein